MGKLVQLQRGIATVIPGLARARDSQNASQERRFNRPRSTDCEHPRMKQHPKPQRGQHCGAVVLATVLFAPSPARAVSSIPSLDPTVVVSTRTPLGMDRITASVDAITMEEIGHAQDRSLIETIGRTPGMVLWANGARGNISSLSIRGTESNHTSLFLDGRRMSPGFGNQYDLGFLTPTNADRVEIQRGSSSVQYGSSNIGGVIDTRLRSGLGLSESEGSLMTELGSNDYLYSGFDYRAGSNSIGFSLSTNYLTTDNERANDAYEQFGFTSRFDYQLNKNLFLELVATGYDNEKELPGVNASPTPFDNQDTTSWLISPGIRYVDKKLSVHLFYSRAERSSDIFEINTAFNPSPPFGPIGDFPIDNHIQIISDEVNLQADYSLTGESMFSMGVVFRNDDVINTNINTFSPLDPPVPYSESFQQVGIYTQLLWMLDDDTELRIGLRHDNYSDYDNETTGNIVFVHQLNENAQFHAKVATSYAPPSPVDLAYDSDTSTALHAETSLCYEVGIQQALMGDRLQLSGVLFRNEIEDLLSFEPGTFDTFNVEEATTEGLELSASYQATDELELSLGYTYLRAVSDRLNDPRTGGFVADPANNVHLARRPRHLVQVGALWEPQQDFLLGLQAVAQLNREDINPTSFLQEEAEDFIVWRLVGNWQINESWSTHARIENLFDEEYSSARGYPALGRTAYIGAKLTF